MLYFTFCFISFLFHFIFVISSNSDMTHMWEVADADGQLDKRLEAVTITESSQKKQTTPDQSKNILDGIRSSIARPRTRSDDFGDDRGQFRPEGLATIMQNVEQKNGGQQQQQQQQQQGRRWSESGAGGETLSVGAVVKVLVDYKPVKNGEIGVSKGQTVRVLEVDTDGAGAYRVSSSGSEGWVPAYVLNLVSSGKKPWSIKGRFRRPSFGKKDSRPDVTVATAAARRGETAVLKCARAPGAVASIKWGKMRGGALQSLGGDGGDKYSFEHDEHQGVVAAYVANCDAADAGEYHCTQQVSSGQEVVAVIHLKVRGTLLRKLVLYFHIIDFLLLYQPNWVLLANLEWRPYKAPAPSSAGRHLLLLLQATSTTASPSSWRDADCTPTSGWSCAAT